MSGVRHSGRRSVVRCRRSTSWPCRVFMVALSAASALQGCGDPENKNFVLTADESLGIADVSATRVQNRCNPDSDLGCGTIHLNSRSGSAVAQDDAFVTCQNDSGDLVVRIASSSGEQSDTSVEFRVHQNLTPTGFAYCEGIVADAQSDTDFSRNSCDVLVRHGAGVFAASAFQSCLVVMESAEPVEGKISCPVLRAGAASVFIDEVSFLCQLSGDGT